MKHEETIARLYHVLTSLAEFDQKEVHGVLKGQLDLSGREGYLFASYLRVYGNAASLLKLNQRKDFQACIILARSIFEQAIDITLMHKDVIRNWIEKMKVFTQVERLRAAKKLVEFSKSHAVSLDVSIHEDFIAKKDKEIKEQQERLWSKGERRIQHWSGRRLPGRVALVGNPFEAWHAEHYSQFSWLVHPGLVGVSDISAEGLAMNQGLACWLAAECYREVLRIMIQEFKLSLAAPDIGDWLELARALPFFT